MWHRDLIARLRSELPRWRWKSHLTHRGGTVEGETQKQNLRITLKYARGRWRLSAEGLLGRRQPQWVLTLDEGEYSSLESVLDTILAECRET